MTLALLVLAVPLRVLTLTDALHTATSKHPSLWQARLATAAAQARSDQARAPLLPQLAGSAYYQRTTANFVPRPSYIQSPSSQLPPPTFDTFNFYNFGLNLSQNVWDFGLSTERWHAAQAGVAAQRESERAMVNDLEMQVRIAYFAARAQKSLVEVARETLANQDRHLGQIESLVQVGKRPEVDLAQVQAEQASARLGLIAAESSYDGARLALNQAMGVTAPIDYDVEDVTLPPVAGEEAMTPPMMAAAEQRRPELAALGQQIEAQRRNVRSAQGAYGPAIGVGMGFNVAGTETDNLVWNWNASVFLTWPIFEGLLTRARVQEAEANLSLAEAQRDAERLAVRAEVEQAYLAVQASRTTLGVVGDVVASAQRRHELAEARYQTGLGNIIELGDAQLALTNAEMQRVQAEYNLATARARLLHALGSADTTP